jgi:hypothetical protein
MFYNSLKCFSSIFVIVSYAYFKYFIVFRYIVIVASKCFKTRSGVESPSSPSATSPRYQAWEARAGGGGPRWRGRSHVHVWARVNMQHV